MSICCAAGSTDPTATGGGIADGGGMVVTKGGLFGWRLQKQKQQKGSTTEQTTATARGKTVLAEGSLRRATVPEHSLHLVAS